MSKHWASRVEYASRHFHSKTSKCECFLLAYSSSYSLSLSLVRIEPDIPENVVGEALCKMYNDSVNFLCSSVNDYEQIVNTDRDSLINKNIDEVNMYREINFDLRRQLSKAKSEMQIKIKQLTEEQESFMYSRRNFENQLSAQTSKLEQAEHDLKRSTRKFEFTQDELDQLKLQFDKERAKFETATRDSIQLQDQVSFLLSESDSLKIQLQEAESKTSKSLSKSDRMKEKIKVYQKNLSEAHGEEMEGLYETVKTLTEKLKKKEMELRLNKSDGEVKMSKNVDFGLVKVKNVEIGSKTVKMPEITLKHGAKPEKPLETTPETKNLKELTKKLEKLEKEKLDLQDELNETLREKRVSDVEKRKRVDDSVEASDENKENVDPNEKKSKNGKKQRVVLGEKTNVQVPVKRSTRDKKKVAVNKTMYWKKVKKIKEHFRKRN